MISDKWLVLQNSTMPHLKSRWLLLFISIILIIILSGCDPCNPMGIRYFATLPERKYLDISFVALDPHWGPCGYNTYTSSDVGTTWIELNRDPMIFRSDLIEHQTDCSESCEFIDPEQDQVHYRITPYDPRMGKTLSRSFDGGKTWVDELHVPAWSRIETIYVMNSFADMGWTLKEVRGPFSAITDWKTGTLVAAMGVEGVLIRQKGKDWEWIDVGEYHEIQISRVKMIGNIKSQEWWRAPIIALFLMLNGLRRLNYKKPRFLNIAMLILSIWFFLMPMDLHAYISSLPILWLFPAFEKVIVFELLPPLFILLGLSCAIISNLKSAWLESKNLFLMIAKTSITTGLAYLVIFLVWSQGLTYTNYGYSKVIGLVIILLAVVYIDTITKKRLQNDKVSIEIVQP